MDKTKALQKLLDGTATKKEIELLKQMLASGEISIGRDVNRSVVIIGSGNKIELTAEALGILKPEMTSEEPIEGEPPYMGMRYFDTADAELFYGREALTRELAERVANEPFLAIVGASGSGKSSVARAGLIPALKMGAVHVITPTAHPLESLAASLTREAESVTATSTLMDDLKNDSRSLRLYIRKLLAGSGKPNLLLLVDQFEETFTQCKDFTERRAFIENLLAAADEDEGRVRVALTLRADFYHHCAEYEGLRNALKTHQEYIGAMTADELWQAITTPAKTNGWDFQPGLVDLILSDVGAEPGALPLLSHALLETWKRRQGHTLTLQGYADAGGVKKAITQTAESVYDKLTPSEQTIARGIFLRLTELGEGVQDTRRRVKMDELGQAKEQDIVKKVLKTLTDARLVTTEEDSAEVAHEALIREWGTLRKWLDEDRESLRLHRHLTESAQEWERSGRNELYLIHRGGRLDDALLLGENSIFELNEIELSYLDACRALRNKERRERERRLRYIVFASIAATIIFLVLGSFGWIKSSESVMQTKIALARQLAAQAHLIYVDRSSNQMTAALLAIQSMKLFPTGEAARYLLNDNFSALPVARMTHDNTVLSVAFSPDGKYVVSGSEDGTARVWEAANGKEVARMTHDNSVRSVAFSPDGKYVVSGSWDNTARVWEAASGKEVARMTHDNRVSSVAFSPDGKYVVSGSWDNTARVWEAAGGKEIARMTHDGFVFSVAFSPDGKYIVSESDDYTARVWEVASGKEIARMTHDRDVNSVAFSPDGKYVVSGSWDNTARVWETVSGKEIARMTHNSTVFSVAFSPDGKYIVSGSDDNTARVWEAASGKEIARMTHDGTVFSVAFSPDSKYIVSGSSDNTARVWEAAGRKEIARMTHGGFVFSVAFSPDGKYIVSRTGGNTARVWEAAGRKEIARMTHDAYVFSVAFSPDGKYIASGSGDSTTRVWEAASGKEIARMTHDRDVTTVAFSPDGKYIVSGSWDHTARVWEAASGKEVARMTHDNTVHSVAFSPDGKYIVSGSGGTSESDTSGSDDNTARVWEAASGKEVARMTHDGPVIFVAFSPDGKYIVSGSWDGTTRVWEVASGKEVVRMTHDGGVNSVAFSPDGKYIVSGSEDNTARVWEAASGKEVARMTHDNTVHDVAFSSDSKYIVSGSYDSTARVWEAASGKEVARMTHDDAVFSVAFSPDGKYIVSGSGDNTARVWEATSGKEVVRMTYDDSAVFSVAFSPDGKYTLSGSGDNTARVWVWQAEDLIANACKVIPRNLTRAEWQQYIGDALPYQAVCPNLPIEPKSTPTP